MSGDVQPRKRKDKKRKKDELSVGAEELHAPGPGARGTAAIFGEGDVFLHTHHDHGTGGHWCAKVIFFSLLAVLITLIGLIILENRGLSELEANAVESRYASVLEGWLEDAPDDDHHDEHTLELKHHNKEGESEELQTAYRSGDHEDDEEHGDDDDEDEEQNLNKADHEDEDEEHSQEDENDLEDNASEEENDDDDEEDLNNHKYVDDEDEQTGVEENDDQEVESNEQRNEEDYNEEEQRDDDDEEEQRDDEEEGQKYDDGYDDEQENYENEQQNDDDEQENNDASEENELDGHGTDDDDEAYGSNDAEEHQDNGDSQEKEDEEHDDDDDHEEDENEETEVEHIEQEPDEEPISLELPVLPQPDDGDDNDQPRDAAEDDDEEFLEQDEIDNQPPVVERITAPAGKPFQEVDDDETPEPAPVDTLAEEEEYERRQEELRREQEEASHMWLKLGVGGALLVATHAVLRRAAAPRDEPANEDETETVREETPISDRRMTFINEDLTPAVTPKFVPRAPQKKVITEEMFKQNIPSIVQSSPTPLHSSVEEEETAEEEELEEDEEETPPKAASPAPKEELYSDEEEEKVVAPKKVEPKQSAPFAAPEKEESEPKEESPEPDEDVPDDVEIIEEEDIEEELEEEEISDVDDVELLTRLEAKYGRLPDPERPSGYKIPKDGGNSLENDWPGEPSDAYWRRELDSAERDLRQGAWEAAAARSASPELASSGRAKYILAKALDELAEVKRDNRLLGRSIAASLDLLKMNEKLSDKKLLEIAERTVNRMYFRGTYLSAEPVHRVLIRRFPNDPAYRNNLTITYLMANRADLAAEVLQETLARWPKDRVALAHYAFVLKTHYNRLEEAVDLFQKALEGDTGPANEPRFYFHLGDSLLLLGRYEEAQEVHKRGAKLGHFLSPAQRSLYNVDRLKSRPWWNVDETPYAKLARALEKSWKTILREGQAAKALYEAEKEGLRERGEWSQLDLYARGREIPDRCSRAPVTCSIVRSEPSAIGCRRGQIKFSSMQPGTHVRPHVGPTNCRLRMHLALSNTEGTHLRVGEETRQWQVGKVLMFDDSFEHEVWHNGSATRLVLIVDVWHPDLTAAERRSLPAI